MEHIKPKKKRKKRKKFIYKRIKKTKEKKKYIPFYEMEMWWIELCVRVLLLNNVKSAQSVILVVNRKCNINKVFCIVIRKMGFFFAYWWKLKQELQNRKRAKERESIIYLLYCILYTLCIRTQILAHFLIILPFA